MDEQDKIERRVFITESGQQITAEYGSGMTVEIFIPDDPVAQSVPVDVTGDEFREMQEQAVTNDIPADILSNKKAD